MLDKFDEKCQKAIVTAESICFDKGHERVDTCHLLLALLQMDVLLTKELKKYGVDYTSFAKRVEYFFPKKEVQPFYLEYGDVFLIQEKLNLLFLSLSRDDLKMIDDLFLRRIEKCAINGNLIKECFYRDILDDFINEFMDDVSRLMRTLENK